MFFAIASLLMDAAMAMGVTDTLTVRIKAMRCEECAHKVNIALGKDKGVLSTDFNLERRTVTVEYDPTLTCRDTICDELKATGRYKPTAYNPKEMIRRGMGLQMAEIDSEETAERITHRLKELAGIDSVGPHVDKQYMFIRYDANKTCKADIKKALLDMGLTPTTYYTSKIISYAYFGIPRKAAGGDLAEDVLALDGVDDVTINTEKQTMAITYLNTETNEEKLLKDLKKIGIQANKKDSRK